MQAMRLGGERLVELDEVEVLDADPGALERLARGRHRADAHDRRVDARRRPSTTTRASGLQAELARPLRLDEQHRRRAVVDPGAVAGGHGAAVAERRPELRERLGDVSARGCSSRATTIGSPFRCGTVDRDDLVVEAAGLDRGDGPLLAREREGVLALARRLPSARRRSRRSRPSSTGSASRRASG